MKLKMSMILLASAGMAAAAIPSAAIGQAEDTSTPPPLVFPGWGFNMADLDPSVKPGDDFNAYVNGKWLAATPIPAKYPEYGVSRNLDIRSEEAVLEIINDAIKANGAPGTIQQKIADAYRSFLDVPAIDKAGLAPAQPYLTKIQAAKDMGDIAELFAMVGMPSPLGGGDPKCSNRTGRGHVDPSPAGISQLGLQHGRPRPER